MKTAKDLIVPLAGWEQFYSSTSSNWATFNAQAWVAAGTEPTVLRTVVDTLRDAVVVAVMEEVHD